MEPELASREELLRRLRRLEAQVAGLEASEPEAGIPWPAVLEVLPDPIFIKDRAGVYLACNQAFLDLLGRPRSEVLGRTAADVQPPQLARTFLEADQALWTRPGSQTYEAPLRLGNGRVHQVVFRKTTYAGPDGQIAGLIGNIQDITNETKIKERLRLERDRTRTYLDTAEVILVVLDRLGRIKLVNAWGCQTLGYDEDQLKGRDWFETCLPPALRETKRADYQEFLNGGTGERHQGEIITRSGQRRRILWRRALLRDATGSVSGAISSGLDFTDTWEAERALAQSEARFQKAFDISPEGISINRMSDGVYVHINQAFTRASGYSPAEVLGRPTRDLGIWADKADLGRLTRELKEHGFLEGFETAYRMKDGRVVPALVSAAIITLDDEPHVITISRDISAMKEAEQRLRQSEEKFAKAFQGSPVWVVISSRADGRYLEVNDTFLKDTGFTRQEIIGQTSLAMGTWVNPDDREALLAEVDQKGRVRNREIRRRRKDGSELTVLFSAEPMEVAGEDCLVSVSMDITSRVRDREEKLRLEGRLRQAQKMEALGTLAGGIAHDFNNVLSAMVGYTELALGQLPADQGARADLRQVLAAGRRAKNVIRQILSFSRQGEQEQRPMALAPILEEAVGLLRASLPTSVALELIVEEPEAAILGDATQIHQVLMNLATNAAQAMGSAGGRLGLRLYGQRLGPDPDELVPGLTEGEHVILEVADDGPGMDAATQERIFEPFFTTKSGGEGTGLGLAVVHGIVASHRGAVTLDSALGQGSRFRIWLPRLEGPPEDQPDPEAVELPRGWERILLVDDEVSLVEVTGRVLDQLGYQVTGKDSPLAAWEAFREDPLGFDLVISDQTMPRISGMDLARRILDIRPGMPIILCTGFSDEVGPREALELGVRRYLLKPLTARKLAREVRAVLDEAGA